MRATPKATLAKPTAVANAHINCIISLPVVFGSQPNKVYDFYEKLILRAQALEAMRKLNETKSYVRNTLDKLPGIRVNIMRLDDSSQDWGFYEVGEALRMWTKRNPKIIANEKILNEIMFTMQKRKNKKPATVSVTRKKDIY